MKVLITVSSYYPKGDGVSAVTQYLAEGLVRKGHDVKVVTSRRDGCVDNELHNGVRIIRVTLRTKYGLYFGKKKEYKELIEKETKRADVMINVCSQNAFTDVILKNIEKYKCKKVLYMHGMFDFGLRAIHFSSLAGAINKLWKEVRWFFYYKLNGKYFKKYDSVIQLHEQDYGNVFFKKKYGIRSMIIENAASGSFFNHRKQDGFKKPFDKYIILVANYNDGKNQKLAISEFLKSDIDPKIGLVLIGSEENTYYNHLKNYVNKKREEACLGQDDKPILLLHGVERKDIASYVSNAYLSLMTSKWEVFPVSIVESIASGVPYISTDVGVVRYFFGGVTSKKQEIHYWMEKLVQDPTLRDGLAELCIVYGREHFRRENKIDLLEKTIVELMEKARKADEE